ncbi:MAG: type II toxin-antitoxin system ParD family antitoxin [Pyrinomonadaceae bacterium]|jgi:antitoxin ParD1/3/4|nr:type II toxin-antitoxin system ParD family antitoxin [Pyrinomonadaceae bacterium]
MTLSLTPELESIISQKVKTGGYSSETEVVQKALKLLDNYDRLREIRREELRNEIQKGVDDIKEGRYKVYQTGEEIAEDVIARAKKRGKLI